MKVFKARLNGALSDLVWDLEGVPVCDRGSGLDVLLFKVPSNTNRCMVLCSDRAKVCNLIHFAYKREGNLSHVVKVGSKAKSISKKCKCMGNDI